MCEKDTRSRFQLCPSSPPSQLHPSLRRRRRAGRGSNLKCNVCQNYLPGDQALWQAVGGSVEGGDSTCADAMFVRGGFCQHAYVYGCARVQRADKAMCVCVITYVAPPSPLYPPHASRDHAQYRRRARRGRSWSYRSGERGAPVPSSSRRRTTCRTTGCCPRRTRHRHRLRVSPGEGAAGP